MSFPRKVLEQLWPAGLSDDARRYMLQPEVYTRHIEILTGELNTTGLAEDAADEFELYIDDDPTEEMKIPEDVFDLAHSVENVLIDRGIVEKIP